MLELKGIFPPHITPFTKHGDVDKDALAGLVRYWISQGSLSLVTCGSNGEAPYLSREERRLVIKTVLDSAESDVSIIVGAGVPSTSETVMLCRDVKDLGADAVLVVSPYYFRPSGEELYFHYKTVAEAVDIPLIIYNVPKFTGYNLEPSLITRLAEEFSQIIGVKDSSGSIGQISNLVMNMSRDKAVMAGTADLIYSSLCIGCKGAIVAVANIIPKMCSQLYTHFVKGEFEEAKQIQFNILRLEQVVIKKYNQISAIKAAMNLLGLDAGYPRAPSLPLSSEAVREIQSILESILTRR